MDPGALRYACIMDYGIHREQLHPLNETKFPSMVVKARMNLKEVKSYTNAAESCGSLD